MVKVINKSTVIELEHPETGKVCLANCVCCAKSKLAEKGLFDDTPAVYVCKMPSYNKKGSLKVQKSRVLTDLNYCCNRFELSKEFTSLGYRVVGKYNAKKVK